MITHFRKSIWFQMCFCLVISFTTTAQEISVADNIPPAITDCIKKSKDGKLRFYFRTDYNLTSPTCASFFRESAFDSVKMVFDGPFKDYRYDSLLLTEGNYKNGYLDGTLTIRYMNGKIWQKGTYQNGLMIGTWEYFYPNGAPMYSFTIKDDRLWINNVWDQNGKQLVKDGNGEAKIYHYTSKDRTNAADNSWRGKVKDGLMQGKWSKYEFDKPTDLKQVYANGKFVKGYESGKFYDAISYFGLGQEQALISAEKLTPAKCEENFTNAFPPVYPNGELELWTEIYKEIDKNLKSHLQSCIVLISFKVDEDGKLSEFKDESATGLEIHVINALKGLGPWLPATNMQGPVPLRITYTFTYWNKWDREKHKAHRGLPENQTKGAHYFEDDPWKKPYKMSGW